MANKFHVALINPNLITCPAVAPYALDVLGAALIQGDYEVSLLDLTPSADAWESAVEEFFKLQKPDFIAVTFRNAWDLYFPSLYALPEHGSFLPSHRRIIDKIAAYFPREKIIAGGVGFSSMPQVMLERLDLSLGIIGPGEGVLLRLLERLVEGKVFDDLPFVVQRGKCFKTENVLSLGAGVRQGLINNQWYYDNGECIGLRTYSGCPQECVYCSERYLTGGCVKNSLKNILVELNQLVCLGVRDIHLCDSESNIPLAFSKEVARAIIAENFPQDLRFWSYMQPMPFDKEYAHLWRKAGMAGINFGTDHTDTGMLRTLGKKYEYKDISQTTKICNDEGIAVLHELLFGMYGETMDSIKRTIDLIWGLNSHVVGVSIGIGIMPASLLAHDRRIIEAAAEMNELVRIEKYGVYCRGIPLEDPTYLIDPSLRVPDIYVDLRAFVGERINKIMIPTVEGISSHNSQLVNNERIMGMKVRQQKGAHWYYYSG